MSENEYKINVVGYDEYGKFQHETIIVTSTPKVTTLAYACLGLDLPKDFIAKIGEWFWK